MREEEEEEEECWPKGRLYFKKMIMKPNNLLSSTNYINHHESSVFTDSFLTSFCD